MKKGRWVGIPLDVSLDLVCYQHFPRAAIYQVETHTLYIFTQTVDANLSLLRITYLTI